MGEAVGARIAGAPGQRDGAAGPVDVEAARHGEAARIGSGGDRQGRKQGVAGARRHHRAQGLQAGGVAPGGRAGAAGRHGLVAQAIALVEEQEVGAGDVGGPQRPAPGEGMLGRAGELERLDEERRDGEARGRHRQRHERGVDAAVAQALQDLGRARLAQGERQQREFLAQGAQDQREQVGPEGLDRRQDEAAGERRAAPLARQHEQALRLGHHDAGLPHDGLPGRRQHHPAVAALEQGEAEEILQLAHLHAQGRLADVAALGGPAEMHLLGHGDDVFEIAQGQAGHVHRLPIMSFATMH